MGNRNDKFCDKLIEELKILIPNPKSELEYSNTFELLIAVVLSAQCTDKRVNEVTRELFKVYNKPEHFAILDCSVLENYIKSCNYYKNKAKNIIATSKLLLEKFEGQVPCDHNDLVSLPGVGNKTANVVEAVAFNKQAFAVDTHILRVANRLGLSDNSNPTKCENDLKKLFVKYDYGLVHHLLLLFGRYYCVARNPKCDNCRFKKDCVFYNKTKGDSK